MEEWKMDRSELLSFYKDLSIKLDDTRRSL